MLDENRCQYDCINYVPNGTHPILGTESGIFTLNPELTDYIKQENSMFLKIYGMGIRQSLETNVLLLAENGTTLSVRYMFRKSMRTVIFFLSGKARRLQI